MTMTKERMRAQKTFGFNAVMNGVDNPYQAKVVDLDAAYHWRDENSAFAEWLVELAAGAKRPRQPPTGRPG